MNRYAVHSLHGYLSNVFKRACQSYSSYEILIVTLFYIASTSILVVLFYRIIKVAHSKTKRSQPITVYCHLILLHISTPSIYFCHAFSAGKLLAHNPVLHCSYISQRKLLFISFLWMNGVLVNLPKSCTDRCKTHLTCS